MNSSVRGILPLQKSNKLTSDVIVFNDISSLVLEMQTYIFATYFVLNSVQLRAFYSLTFK